MRFDESELLDRIDDLVCVHDLEGNVRWANAAALRALGWSLDELTRKNLAEILAPEGLVKLGAYLETIRSEGRAEGTMRVVTRSGEHRHWEFRNALHAEEGAAPLVYGVARDITERDLDAERRRVVGTRLRLALEASNVGLWDWDLESNKVHYSREWKRQIGYQDDEISDDFAEWRSRCHPDDVERVLARVESCLLDPRKAFEVEYRFRHRDGRWLWILSRAEVLRDAAGRPQRMLGCHVDLTERKAIERALAASEDRYRDLIEHGQELICTHDLDGRILSLNPWAAHALGRPIEELIRKNVRDVLAPERRHEFETYLATLRRDGSAHGYMVVETGAGERRVWEYRNTVRTEGVAAPVVRGMAHDVTERVRAEKAVRLSEARYRALFESAPDGIFVVDAEGRFVDASPSASVSTGYTRDELLGLRIADLALESELPRLGLALAETAAGARKIEEWRFRRKDGSTRVGEIQSALLPDGRLLGILRDVTERKRTEEALRESEARFARLIDNFQGVAYRCRNDPDWTLEFVSRGIGPLTGHEPEEFFGGRAVRFGHLIQADDRERVWDTVQAALGRREPWEVTYRLVHRTGEVRWCWERGCGVFDEQGELRFLEGFVSDVTERKRAEEALREREELFAAFMRTMPLISFMKDADGRLIYVNDAFEQSFGIQLAESRGKTDAELWPPETARQLRANDIEILARGQPTAIEETVERPDGLQTWISYKFPFRDAKGRMYLAGTAINITERKRVEAALRESEEKFAKAFRSHPAIIALTTLDGRTVDANQAYLDLAGMSREEVLGKTVAELGVISVGERQKVLELAARNGGSLRNAELSFQLRDGRVRHMLVSVEPLQLGGVPHRLTTLLDVTERRRAEEELAASEAKFRTLAESLQELVYRADAETFVATYVNSAVERFYGYTAAEWLADPSLWERTLHDEDRERVFAEFESARAAGRAAVIEYRIVRRDSEIRWVEDHAFWLYDAAGEIEALGGTMVDITERKRAEELLRVSQEQLRALVEQAPISIAMFDREMRYLVASRRWAAEYSRGFFDLEGRSHYEVHPDLPERWKEVHRRGLAGETLRNDDDLWIQADGTKNWLRWAILPWRDAQGEIGGIILSAEDITERRRAEEEVRALPRRLLAAQEEERRRIARELHDELGQILTAVKLNLQALGRRESPVATASLGPALASLERALAATHDLSLELRPSILDDLGLIPALRWQLDRFGRDAELAVHFATDLGDERFAPELETVCFRVAQEALTNVARHAAAREVWLDLGREDGWLALSVRDDGRGFDLDAATARAAAGESLGLLGMRERIALVGGEIEIRPRPGGGTEVAALLPLAYAGEAPSRGEEVAP